jgi:photosystem I reaction center subunit XII
MIIGNLHALVAALIGNGEVAVAFVVALIAGVFALMLSTTLSK